MSLACRSLGPKNLKPEQLLGDGSSSVTPSMTPGPKILGTFDHWLVVRPLSFFDTLQGSILDGCFNELHQFHDTFTYCKRNQEII